MASEKMLPLGSISFARALSEAMGGRYSRDTSEGVQMEKAALQLFIDVNEDTLLSFSRSDEVTALPDGWSVSTCGNDGAPWHKIIEISNAEFAEKYFLTVEIEKEMSERGQKAISDLDARESKSAGDNKKERAALLISQILNPSEERLKLKADENNYLKPEECSKLVVVNAYSSKSLDEKLMAAIREDAYHPAKLFSMKPSINRGLGQDRFYSIYPSGGGAGYEAFICLEKLSDGMKSRGYAEAAKQRINEMLDVEYLSSSVASYDAFNTLGFDAILKGDGLFTARSTASFLYVERALTAKCLNDNLSDIVELPAMLLEGEHTSKEDIYSCNDGRTEAYVVDGVLFVETQNGKFKIEIDEEADTGRTAGLSFACTADTSYESPHLSDRINGGKLDLQFRIAGPNDRESWLEGRPVTFEGRPKFSSRTVRQFNDVLGAMSSIHCCLEDDLKEKPQAPGF